MPYKDKEKHKAVQRDWVRQKRANEKGSTAIVDFCGTEYPIDFEGRRKDWDGRGYLARQYSIINGFTDKDNNLTIAGRRYLGQNAPG